MVCWELDAGPAKVDTGFRGFDPGDAFYGDICGGDTELAGSF